MRRNFASTTNAQRCVFYSDTMVIYVSDIGITKSELKNISMYPTSGRLILESLRTIKKVDVFDFAEKQMFSLEKPGAQISPSFLNISVSIEKTFINGGVVPKKVLRKSPNF